MSTPTERNEDGFLSRISSSTLSWTLTGVLVVAAQFLHSIAVAEYATLSALPGRERLLDTVTGAVLMVALFALCEVQVIHVRLGKSAHSVSVVEAIVVIALFHSSPTATLFAVCIGTAGTLLSFRKQSRLKAAFNTASYAFSSQLAWVAFLAFRSPDAPRPLSWAAALAAAALFATSGAVLVWIVIGIHERAFRVASLRDGFRFTLGAAVLTTASGIVTAILLTTAPLAAPLMVLPVVGAYLSNMLYSRERRRAEELNFLQRSSESVLTEEVQTSSVRAMIEQAVRELKVQYIEVEFDDDGTAKRFEANADVRSSSANESIPPGHLRTAFPSLKQVTPATPTLRKRGELGYDDIGDAIRIRSLASAVLAPIHVGDRTIGTLLIGDRGESVFTLGHEEIRVAETLASHIALVVETIKLKRSVGDLLNLERQLVTELQHDSLTGLLNRSAFIRKTRDNLTLHAAPGQNIALMFIDLDDFKRVNDSSGHAAGDSLLCDVAESLRAVLRPGDLAARLGGDEFAVLLTRITDVRDAESTARRVSAALCRPFIFNGKEHAAGASIGLVLPSAGDDYESLAERADMAMYRAKAAGKGTIETIDPATDEADQRAKQLIGDLRRSLQRDELQVDFQPVVSLETESVESFEALVRWQHPSLGLLQPATFLKVGHDEVTLSELDNFVLNRATASLTALRVSQPGTAISVNIRGAQLSDDRLLALLGSMRNLDPALLLLEVSISDLERSIEATVKRLSTLRDAGFGIVIDDIAIDSVGYRILEAVRPVQVKLARSVTQRLHEPTTFTIVRSIVSVGHEVGFTVAVKGVETATEADSARRAGCTSGQGFLYSRAIRLDQFGTEVQSAREDLSKCT